MPTIEIEISDLALKGISLATSAFNETESAAALARKEDYTPLTDDEYATLRFNGAAESWYQQHTKISVEPLKAKLEKLTDPQLADIEARIKAYVPDPA